MKNVPKLRFSGFSDEWEEKILGGLVDYKKGYAFKTDECTSDGIRVIKISDTTDSSINDEANTFIDKSDYEKYKNWELFEEDILVSTVGSRPPLYSSMVGKVVKVPKTAERTLLNQNLVKLIPNKLVDNDFLFNVLKKPKYTKHIENICRGNANQVSITLEDLFEYKIFTPAKEEQEKIANFLTKVDKIIEKQEEKVSNLEKYKKGMMQKIFSPEIRFKKDDGGEYPEWEKKHLGNLVERVVRKNKGNVTKRPLTISAQYGLVDQEEFFNKVVASANLEGYYLLNKGEFAYNKSYSNGYPFGAIKRLDRYENGAVSTLYICFIPKEDVDSNYLVQYFESDMWHKEVSMIAVEGARNHGLLNISVTDFFETIHRIPCLEEQSKIANFLSKIDLVVEKEKEMLEELRKWKKGLLQQMFV